MNENERIVCEFLREIAPSREWRYLGEVEHYLIGELCDELNKQLNADNAKLRELVRDVHALHWNGLDCTECPWFDECDTTGGCPWLSIFADHMRELGIEVDE